MGLFDMGVKRIGILMLMMASVLRTAGYAQNAIDAKVVIPLIARESHRRLAVGLSTTSLVVSEHKVPVTEFALLPGADLPLELGIIIDTSRSVQEEAHLEDLIEAAKQFAKDTLLGAEDRVFFSTFAIQAEATGWLRRERLAGLKINLKKGQGTALYDSVAAACRERMGVRDWSRPTRRVLVVISDGDDNLSHITHDQAASQAIGSGVVIFTVDTQSDGLRRRGERILQYWADATGGEAFSGLGRGDAPKVFETIRQTINGMYYVNYAPPPSDNQIHEVEIKPAAKQRLDLSYPRKYLWSQ